MGKVQFANLDTTAQEFARDQHCPAGVAGGRCGKIAIVHFVNYKKGTQTRGCMKSVMRYVSQLGKTLWDGQQLVSGIGCQPETAFDEFLSTKLLHNKAAVSSSTTWCRAFERRGRLPARSPRSSTAACRIFRGLRNPRLYSHRPRTHPRTASSNSVNFETGKKIHIADEQIQALRVCNDQICGNSDFEIPEG